MSHNEQQFDRLVKIAEPLKGPKEQQAELKAKMWQDSPLAWVYLLPAPTIGSVGRKLVERLLRDEGLSAYQHKFLVHVAGQRVAVKFSALGLSREYFFQNVQESGYDFLFCLGISPDKVHAWTIPVEKFKEATDQHGKADKWDTVNPNKPPKLFRDCNPSGTLEDALKVLRGHLGV